MTREEILAHFEREPFEPIFIKLLGEDGSRYEVHDSGHRLTADRLTFFLGPDRENVKSVPVRHIDSIRLLSEVAEAEREWAHAIWRPRQSGPTTPAPPFFRRDRDPTRDELIAHFERQPFVPLFVKLIGEDGSTYEIHEAGCMVTERDVSFFQGPDREYTMWVPIEHIEVIRPLAEMKDRVET